MTDLTDEQEAAVERRQGSLLLAAGAGSGKTSVLVERFARAVREDGVPPSGILAITFTERAAGELRERIRARLLELGQREAAQAAEGANVSTFHGFCARLLRHHPLQAGLDPAFQIAEEGLAERLRALAFGDAFAGFIEGEREDAVELVAAYDANGLRAMVLDVYAQLRSQGDSAPSLPYLDGATEAARAWRLIGELLVRFGEAYALRKRERSLLDFDDLELRARDLLIEHAPTRGLWAERFQLVMVDELQDSNARQLEILGALERENLFVVGDELQSIYGFRYADVGLFRDRRDRLARAGACLRLARNFRSRPAIMDAVQRLFAARMGERFASLQASREEGNGKEPIVELLLTDKRGWSEWDMGSESGEDLQTAAAWRVAEARLLAERIAELVESRDVRPGEVAVLVRALGELPVYESALRRLGIPAVAAVGGFWKDRQVGDLLAWLRALANPMDELALYEALASPLVGLSSDALALIALAANEHRGAVWEEIERAFGQARQETSARAPDRDLDNDLDLCASLPEVDRRRLATFADRFATERSAAPMRSLAALVRSAIAASGYEAYVLSLPFGERRLANMRKLVRLARDYEARNDRDLRGFLDHVAHMASTRGGRESDAPVADGELDAVHLMSIHAAKGLEFPVVCVADLGRKPRRAAPDLIVERGGEAGSAKLGLRLRRLGGREPVAELDYEELRERREAAEEEEEDRVLYVACTRARERLLLSGAVSFERWPEVKQGAAPIAWLAPALVPEVPEFAAREDPALRETTIGLDELQVRCVFNTPASAERDRTRQAPNGGDDEIRARHGPSIAQGTAAQAAVDARRPVATVVAWPPEPLSGVSGTMSYSSLAELERCGYRFYLERVLHMPERRGEARTATAEAQLDPRVRGTIVHALLETIDFTRPALPTTASVASVARSTGADVGESECEEIARLIERALEAEPARRIGAGEQVRREIPFAFALASDEPLASGVLDLILRERNGTTLIVDYKSDRIEDEADLEELVRRDYGLQRLVYALAAIEQGAQEVEIAHWFLEQPARMIAVRYKPAQRDLLRARLLDRLRRARENGYAVSDDPHRALCLTCPGRGALCSWGESRTLAERSTTLESDA